MQIDWKFSPLKWSGAKAFDRVWRKPHGFDEESEKMIVVSTIVRTYSEERAREREYTKVLWGLMKLPQEE